MNIMKLTRPARQIVADAICPEGRERRDLAERLADTDQLTKLPNRRAFDRAIATAEGNPGIAVVLFDGDNFGRVNKFLGYSEGDKVIQDMAWLIQDEAHKYGGFANRVFRIGGDEFVALVPFRYSGLLRDSVENEYAKWNKPLAELGITGVIGNTLKEADNQLQARKRHRNERRQRDGATRTLSYNMG